MTDFAVVLYFFMGAFSAGVWVKWCSVRNRQGNEPFGIVIGLLWPAVLPFWIGTMFCHWYYRKEILVKKVRDRLGV